MVNRRLTVAALAAGGWLVAATAFGTGEASTQSGGADAYQDAWGPSVGDAVPPIAAEDQHGNVRDLASLTGPGGLVLVVSRSAVW
ncbi:MAG: hypothetical protein F4029_20125 [Gammaproteobacteria bacterium]|nr:hypothetical protein [Gammaproteobacteria bacterium]MYF30755.1 hypothetical protein [Gammaproteobacteria bacterium]MYK48521.1 hypothetical protein [Gammaproteobacteria bacterium]